MRIKMRRGDSSVWASRNPVLEMGEPGFETDSGRFKIGDGRTSWNSLSYQDSIGTVDGGSLEEHIASETPHPIYDDGPSLALIYENSKV